MLSVCVMFVFASMPGVGFLSESCYVDYNTFYEPAKVILVSDEDNWYDYSEHFYYAPEEYYRRNSSHTTKFSIWRDRRSRSVSVHVHPSYQSCGYNCRERKRIKRQKRRTLKKRYKARHRVKQKKRVRQRPRYKPKPRRVVKRTRNKTQRRARKHRRHKRNRDH